MTDKSATLSWRNYYELCKPRVVALIVFTAIVGMLLAVPGFPPLSNFVYGTLGIALAAASAAAINHFIDRKADAQMARTKHRPLPSGELSSRHVLIFAGVIGTLAMALLIVKINVLTAFLTFLSLIGYAVIYTVYLKKMTPQNIVIGGIAGAAPPLLGWTAITGQIHPHALLLVLIIFVWTPPHFWALAIARRDEYAKVAIPMLPVTHGVEFTRLQILLYTILLLISTLLPYLTGMSGLLYLLAAISLSIGFLYFAVLLIRKKDDKTAMRTFGYSIIYLMLIFAALLIDHYYPLSIRHDANPS